MTDFPAFSYIYSSKKPLSIDIFHIYTQSPKRYPSWAAPNRVGYNREYPPPLPLRSGTNRLLITVLINFMILCIGLSCKN